MMLLRSTTCVTWPGSVGAVIQCDEEVNMISLNPYESHMATADDSGLIQVVDLKACEVVQSLCEHDSCVTAAKFHPSRLTQLYSCGCDSQLIHWDLTQGSPHCTLPTSQIIEEAPLSSLGCLLNPPLAHCLDISPCGRFLAVGLESRQVVLMELTPPSLSHSGDDDETLPLGMVKRAELCGHTQGVSQVLIPPPLPDHNADDCSLIISTGNDAKINLWRLDPCSQQSPEQAESLPMESDGNTDQQLSSNTTGALSVPLWNHQLVQSTSHRTKINWVAPLTIKGQFSLLVADLSTAISCYPASSLGIV